jgi:hypothetical protein
MPPRMVSNVNLVLLQMTRGNTLSDFGIWEGNDLGDSQPAPDAANAVKQGQKQSFLNVKIIRLAGGMSHERRRSSRQVDGNSAMHSPRLNQQSNQVFDSFQSDDDRGRTSRQRQESRSHASNSPSSPRGVPEVRYRGNAEHLSPHLQAHSRTNSRVRSGEQRSPSQLRGNGNFGIDNHARPQRISQQPRPTSILIANTGEQFSQGSNGMLISISPPPIFRQPSNVSMQYQSSPRLGGLNLSSSYIRDDASQMFGKPDDEYDEYIVERGVAKLPRVITGPRPSKPHAKMQTTKAMDQKSIKKSVSKKSKRVKVCHDRYCLVLFLFITFLSLGVTGLGFYTGNLQRLVYSTDSEGNICGSNRVRYLKDEKLLLTFNYSNPASYKKCVSSCPDPTVEPVACKYGTVPGITYDEQSTQVQSHVCVWTNQTGAIFNKCVPSELLSFTLSSKNISEYLSTYIGTDLITGTSIAAWQQVYANVDVIGM